MKAVKVSDYELYVPHRPPMVWVDEVLSAAEKRGECAIFLKEGSLYLDEKGFIRRAAYIEWIAQGYAYVRTAYLTSIGQNEKAMAREAFLVGIKDAQFFFEGNEFTIRPPDELRVHVSGFREFGPIMMLNGEVKTVSGRTLMRANLRVYQR